MCLLNHILTASQSLRCILLMPMAKICKECGYPLQGHETICPECGCPVEQRPSISTQTSQENQQETIEKYASGPVKTDWAQYFYECGVIGWEAFKKYFSFNGRSSRREFWSLYLIWCAVDLMVVLIRPGSFENLIETIYTTSVFSYLIFFFPILGASIRRLHDIGKSGWWCICPVVPLFLYLKRSDVGANKYGIPNPAKNLL